MDKIKYLDPIIEKSNRIFEKIIPKLEKHTIEGYKNPGEGDAGEHNYDGHHGPHVNIPFLDLFWMPHQKSIMKYIVIWMAFNLFGMFIMIFMVDMKGDGLIRGGMVSRFFSALLRVITMNSFAVKVVKEKVTMIEDKDNPGQYIKAGGSKKKSSNFILRALYFIVLCLIMGILFPKKILNAIESFNPSVPITNTGKVGKNMGKNYETTKKTIQRMRSGPDSTVTLDAEKQLANIARRNEEINAGFRHMDARFYNKRYEFENSKWKAKADILNNSWFSDDAKEWNEQKARDQMNKMKENLNIN